jgi:hypothetical protein
VPLNTIKIIPNKCHNNVQMFERCAPSNGLLSPSRIVHLLHCEVYRVSGLTQLIQGGNTKCCILIRYCHVLWIVVFCIADDFGSFHHSTSTGNQLAKAINKDAQKERWEMCDMSSNNLNSIRNDSIGHFHCSAYTSINWSPEGGQRLTKACCVD